MASNIPQGPEVEGDEREESEDEDDEDYEPTVDDSVVVSFLPDEAVYVDLSETIAETAAAELSISEAFEEALEAVRRSEESLSGAVEVVVDSDEETDGEDANDGRDEEEEGVETTEEKGKGGGGESEGLDKTDRVELDPSLFPSCPVCFETWSADGPHRVCKKVTSNQLVVTDDVSGGGRWRHWGPRVATMDKETTKWLLGISNERAIDADVERPFRRLTTPPTSTQMQSDERIAHYVSFDAVAEWLKGCSASASVSTQVQSITAYASTSM
ncbi:hypothetical protein BHE74_00035689 [Ensete ventricosum]|nr:hypothetical protein BHE74_00035689 [Ensete ventricosum]